MNILYLCADPGIPVRGHKGSAVHVRALSDAFVALGHRVTILTPRVGPADGPVPGARVVEVQADITAADREQAGLAAAEAVYASARALLAADAFDALYERYSLWSDAGARLAREFALPLVLEVNAPLRLEAARYRALERAALAAQLEGRSLAGAQTVVVVSGPLQAYVREQGVPAERVHVLPNAVDEVAFHTLVDGRVVRRRLGLEDRFVLGFVGTVRPWHDLDTLLDALLRLRSAAASPDAVPYSLLLVGNIPAAVRDGLAQRGLSAMTTIVEPVPHAQVPQYIAAMDVAISPHPALAGFYYSPLKLFEYLACGTPTVAADVTPVSDVVTHGETALLYAPGDAAALAEQVAALAADARLRARLGSRGAELVSRRYTWRRNAQQVLDWLSPVAAGRQAAPAGSALPLWDDVLGEPLFCATNRELAEPMLAVSLLQAGLEPLEALSRVEVLKYKPGRRCVVQYEGLPPDARADTGSRASAQRTAVRLIGKVFKDERGAQQYALHQALWADGFDAAARDGISVARPLAYIPEMRMFLQAHVPGQTLDAFVRAPDFVGRVRSSARAIAKLHASHVPPAKRHALDDEVALLEQSQRVLAQRRPAEAPRAARDLDALRFAAQVLPPAAAVPSHRDFYYTQLVFADRRLCLIDLDLFAWADPALDVANFAAHLRFLSLQHLHDANALDAAREAFVDAYMRRAQPSAGFDLRLAYYESATYFRLLGICAERPEYGAHFADMRNLLDRELLRLEQPA